jgi:hypothetical protein
MHHECNIYAALQNSQRRYAEIALLERRYASYLPLKQRGNP